ncbi:MAG TPA: RDD family protein [Parasulfuritortus sp.]
MIQASLRRRLVCLIYEAFLLGAVLFMAGFLVVGLHPGERGGIARLLFQIYLFAVMGGYFVWFWRHGGQTLAMKTWRIRLVDAGGGPVGLRQAWLRYSVAVFTFGFCFVWALFDRDRQFLHDRLAGTRLVMRPI